MATYYLNIGLTYFVIGFGMAILFHFLLKKPFLGNFWGALIVGLVGAFFGGLIDFFFEDIIETLSNLNGSINIFPPIVTSFLLIWVFSKFSARKQDEDGV
jgi:uncharacterized membrane protein YeaQ/YmgE (transglycosylase-associated protein family)